MKSGSGDDLLSDVGGETTETETDEPHSAIQNTADEPPLLLVRDGVKDQRDLVGFYLQQDTQDREADAVRELTAEMDVNLPVMDVREAAYLVGLRHYEETKQLLLDWGYEHRR